MPADNLHKDTLFIVDEASMIANEGLDSFVFGSGRLLDDLIQYVYSGENCRLILIDVYKRQYYTRYDISRF